MQTKSKNKRQAQSFKDLKSMSMLKRKQIKHKSLKVGQLKQTQQQYMNEQITNFIQFLIDRTVSQSQVAANYIKNFLNQVQEKIELVQKFQFFIDFPQQLEQMPQISIQKEPLAIPKFQVIKNQKVFKKQAEGQKMMKQFSKKKIGTLDKLGILTGNNQVNSSKSIKSTRSNKTAHGIFNKIHTIKQQYSQKQRQKKQRQNILNKLKRYSLCWIVNKIINNLMDNKQLNRQSKTQQDNKLFQ